MSSAFRRVRGVVGLGVTWAILWGAAFAVLTVIVGMIDPAQIDPGEGPARVAAIMAGVGLVSGLCFGVLLSLAESGKQPARVSMSRAAIWGVLASVVYPLLTGKADAALLLGILGAGMAVASVGLVRGFVRDAINR